MNIKPRLNADSSLKVPCFGDCVFVLCVILLSGSYFSIIISFQIKLIIYGLFLLYYIVKQVFVEHKYWYKYFIVQLIMIASIGSRLVLSVLDSHIYYGSLLILEMYFLFIVSVRNIEFEVFASIFSRIVVYIAIFSLIGFALHDVLLSLPTPFRIENQGYTYQNYIFYLILGSSRRNCGIFSEPGLFAVFLNLALIYNLFFEKNRKNSRITVLVITIVTTISTTGIFVMLLISLDFVLHSHVKSKMKYVATLLIGVFMTIALFLNEIVNSLIYKFGLYADMEMSTNVTSRINPFILDLLILKDSPIGILGPDYYATTLLKYSNLYHLPFGSSSSSFTMLAVCFGIPFSVISIIAIYKLCHYLKINLFIFAGILFLFSTQSFLLYPLLYIIIAYSIQIAYQGEKHVNYIPDKFRKKC